MSSAGTVYQALDLVAIASAALIGSTAARYRGLDAVGVLCCALITGLGGGLLRDILLQDGVPASLAYRLGYPTVGLGCGAAVGGITYILARWRHWVLPPVERAHSGKQGQASAVSIDSTKAGLERSGAAEGER